MGVMSVELPDALKAIVERQVAAAPWARDVSDG
jgi:hypothetical protein